MGRITCYNHEHTEKVILFQAKTMTPVEILLVILTTLFWTTFGVGNVVIKTLSVSYSILVSLMRYVNELLVYGKTINRLLYFSILNVLFCRSSGYEEKSSVPMEVDNSQKKAPIGTIFWCAKN